MKRILTFLLSICLIATLAPFNYVTSAESEGYYTYEINNKEVTITAVDEAISGAVTVPEELGGYPVTSIGYEAFSGCESITSIIIPEGVESIGYGAFLFCESLTSISIPASTTSIEGSLFRKCNELTSITVDEDNTVYHSSGNCLIETDTGVLISGCNTSVIPTDESVTTIGNSAFFGCMDMVTITLPDSITRIESNAFYDCWSLLSINIPANVEFIGSSAFNSCYDLENVYFENTGNWRTGVTDISPEVLENSQTAAEFLSNTHKSYDWCLIEMYTYEVNGNEATITYVDSSISGDVVVPVTLDGYTVTAIDDNAFSNCDDITSVTISDCVTSIGHGIFAFCPNLEVIMVSPNNPVYHSANNCIIETETKTIVASCKGSTIPTDESVTAIGDYGFFGCKGLESITIPKCVTKIGYCAFRGCDELTDVYFENAKSWFSYNTKLPSLELENSLMAAHHLTNEYTYSIWTRAVSDVLYTYEVSYGEATITSASEMLNGNVEIPKMLDDYPVTAIGDDAFYYCSLIESITIPEGVTYIGDDAFRYCEKLESVSIPSSTTTIGSGLFSNCKSLVSISVSENNPVYRSDGNCLIETDTETLIAGCKSSVIPEGVTYIGTNAFGSCELESITIPSSVTTIDSIAFQNCGSLTSITFTEGLTHIGALAFYACDSLESADLPATLTYIGGDAFWQCTALSSISIPDSVTYIDNTAFFDTAYYNNESNWENGVLYIGNHLIDADTALAGEYEIKSGTKTIASYAFGSCEELVSVSVPDSLTHINEHAFFCCLSLKEVTLGKGLESMGYVAFGFCSDLENVYFEDTEGWWANGTRLDSALLDDPAAAADYLKDTYLYCEWARFDAIPGDLNGDGGVAASDAIYLLYSIFFDEEDYPLYQDCDFNDDSETNAKDAIYLLYHIFFDKSDYPLF